MLRKIDLQSRDRKLIWYIKEQGVATFEQLNRNFFPGEGSCRKRLHHLIRAGYLESVFVNEVFKTTKQKQTKSSIMPVVLDLSMKASTKIYRLSQEYRRLWYTNQSLMKRSLVLHQLLVNESLEQVKKTLTANCILNEPEIKILSPYSVGRRTEICPDFSFETEKHKIAFEVERVIKSKSRYSRKLLYYRDSLYTQIIYLYSFEKHLPVFLELTKHERKVGLAHYREPNKIYSSFWGPQSLNSFLEVSSK